MNGIATKDHQDKTKANTKAKIVKLMGANTAAGTM